MKTSQILALAASGLLASAAPTTSSTDTSTHHTWDNEANDMMDLVNKVAGKTDCADTAVIFARGTFDSGNLGVWVGPDFFNSLSDNLDSVALQGVDSSAYGATLEEYLGEGGSEAGAQSMAQTLESYAACCPTTALVLSGWNQGALVAHKALGMLNAQTASQVAGFVTFGSPYRLFDDIPSVPSHIPTNYQCIEGFNFDPLCASLPEGFRFPDSAWDVIEPFNKLPHFAQGLEETEAAAYMLIQFPAELIEGWSSFVHTLVHDQWARLMITPQSFMYGNDGMAKHAGDWVARLPKVSAPRSS